MTLVRAPWWTNFGILPPGFLYRNFLFSFLSLFFFQILFEKFLKGNWPGNEGKESEGNECNTFPRWNQSRDVSVCMVCILAPRTVL